VRPLPTHRAAEHLASHARGQWWASFKERGRHFQGLGVVPGWPDISIFGEEAKGCQAWFLEVKSDDGRLTDAQKDCQNRLRELGFPVAVVRSIDEAEQALRFWAIPLRGGVA
jgi:hypothetical protein